MKPYVSKEYLFIKIIEEVDESIKADDCSIISISVEDYDRWTLFIVSNIHTINSLIILFNVIRNEPQNMSR